MNFHSYFWMATQDFERPWDIQKIRKPEHNIQLNTQKFVLILW